MDFEVRVNYATANGTASAGSDYVATSGTLVFAPGQTTGPITVLVIGDTRDEADETFLVNLSDASGALVADSQGAATIIDNDPLPTISVQRRASRRETPARRRSTLPSASPPPAGGR